MKLLLSWKETIDGFSPSCSSDIVNKDGFSPLACLLTDDGGQRFLDAVPRLNEGMERIKLIKCSALDSADWSRDTWGAELSKGPAKIYSLYDDDCFEFLSLDAFEIALASQTKFIQLTPTDEMNYMLEIQMGHCHSGTGFFEITNMNCKIAPFVDGKSYSLELSFVPEGGHEYFLREFCRFIEESLLDWFQGIESGIGHMSYLGSTLTVVWNDFPDSFAFDCRSEEEAVSLQGQVEEFLRMSSIKNMN